MGKDQKEWPRYMLRLISGRATEKLRDGYTLSDPVRTVSFDQYTPFKHLPKGMDPEGNHEVEVKIAHSESEAKQLNGRLQKDKENGIAERLAYAVKVKAKIAEEKAKREEKAKKKPKPKQPPAQKATLAGVAAHKNKNK